MSVASAFVIASMPGSRAAAQTEEPSDREAGRILFEQGVAAYRDGRPTEARDLFARSLAAFESPVTAWNLARSTLATGAPLDALPIVERMLAGDYGELSFDQAAAARELYGEVRAGLGRLTLRSTVDVEVEVAVDAEPRGTLAPGAALEVSLLPGTHAVQASAEDGRQFSDRVRLQAGEATTVPVELPVATEDGGSVFEAPLFWVVVGTVVLGGAALAIGLTVGPPDEEVDPVWGNIEALR
ncbi:MAG: hypothetical protein AAGF12_24245 [Myxococcota bacterium]